MRLSVLCGGFKVGESLLHVATWAERVVMVIEHAIIYVEQKVPAGLISHIEKGSAPDWFGQTYINDINEGGNLQ